MVKIVLIGCSESNSSVFSSWFCRVEIEAKTSIVALFVVVRKSVSVKFEVPSFVEVVMLVDFIYNRMMEVYRSRKYKVVGGVRGLCFGFDEEVKLMIGFSSLIIEFISQSGLQSFALLELLLKREFRY